jgi:hypothetical protein
MNGSRVKVFRAGIHTFSYIIIIIITVINVNEPVSLRAYYEEPTRRNIWSRESSVGIVLGYGLG